MAKLYYYYTTERPAGPGALPSYGLMPLEYGEDYDDRTPVYYDYRLPDGSLQKRIYCRAWGIVAYNRPLSVKEQSNYDLKPVHDPLAVGEPQIGRKAK